MFSLRPLRQVTKVIEASQQTFKDWKLKIFKSVSNEQHFNFYLYSGFGVVVIITSARGVISNECVLLADPSRALIQSFELWDEDKMNYFSSL